MIDVDLCREGTLVQESLIAPYFCENLCVLLREIYFSMAYL